MYTHTHMYRYVYEYTCMRQVLVTLAMLGDAREDSQFRIIVGVWEEFAGLTSEEAFLAQRELVTSLSCNGAVPKAKAKSVDEVEDGKGGDEAEEAKGVDDDVEDAAGAACTPRLLWPLPSMPLETRWEEEGGGGRRAVS